MVGQPGDVLACMQETVTVTPTSSQMCSYGNNYKPCKIRITNNFYHGGRNLLHQTFDVDRNLCHDQKLLNSAYVPGGKSDIFLVKLCVVCCSTNTNTLQ